MIADPRARQAVDEFASQWLRFDLVQTAVKDRTLYPQFSPELAIAMTEETKRLGRRSGLERPQFHGSVSRPATRTSTPISLRCTEYRLRPPTSIASRCRKRRNGPASWGRERFSRKQASPAKLHRPCAATSCASTSSAIRYPTRRRERTATCRRYSADRPQTNRDRLQGALDQPDLRGLP